MPPVTDLRALLDRQFEIVKADTPDRRAEIQRLRYQVLVRERGFLPENPSGLEIDRYDAHAVAWLVLDRATGAAAGGSRVILPPDLQIHRWRETPPGSRPGEISRWVIPAGTSHRRLLRLAFLRGVYQTVAEHGLTHLAAILDPSLMRLLSRIGVTLHPLGPMIDLHGPRQPCIRSVVDLSVEIRATNPNAWKAISAPLP